MELDELSVHLDRALKNASEKEKVELKECLAENLQ